ncbi:MAG: sigma-70 family RNA polymerase sigma factor [Verrucomicrobia bacterium]|nr:sigma-70 family RNA polymerase sigma factor [Verrucomicrobiota bacterium]
MDAETPPCWLGKIYDDHAENLFRYFLGSTRDVADAKDLLQDLFVKVARNPRCLSDVKNVRHYLLRMARSQVIDRSRRATVRRATGLLPLEDVALFAPSDDPDVAEFRLQLERALTELPADQSEVVRLKIWEGMTFDEIAEGTGVPRDTAASRFRYGRDKLRNLLCPLYDELS